MPGRAAWSGRLRGGLSVEWQVESAWPEDVPPHEHPGAQAWRPGGLDSHSGWGSGHRVWPQQGVWALGVGC